MIKSLIFGASLIALSSVAFAETYQCEINPGAPGNASYLLVVQKALPGVRAQGIILSQQMGTGSPAWTLISGDATVTMTPDGGPLSIGFVDPRKIDWAAPELKDQCFVTLRDSYWFRLTERTTGVTGTVSTTRSMATNPNKANCPVPMPPPVQKHAITCKNF